MSFITSKHTDIRRTLSRLIEEGHLKTTDADAARDVSGLIVSELHWRQFIIRLLLWVGGLSCAFGVIFFVAANWPLIGRIFKFALLELTIVTGILPFFLFPRHERIRQASLLVAIILTGALMAFFGQTYQTGADPWQLFFNWALLTFPWVLISRFSVIWLLWLGLLNVSLYLYGQTFADDAITTLGLFTLNSLALAAWQGLSSRYKWMNANWARYLVGLVSGIFATAMFVHYLFDDNLLGVLLWFAWSAAVYYYYRYCNLSIFMLAGLCLSVLICADSLVIWIVGVFSDWALNFLVLICVTVGLGVASLQWLRRLLNEERP